MNQRMNKLFGLRKRAEEVERLDPEKKLTYINQILEDLFSKDLYVGYGGDFDDILPRDREDIKAFVLQQISKKSLDENNFYQIIEEKFKTRGERAPNKKEVNNYFYRLKEIQDLQSAVPDRKEVSKSPNVSSEDAVRGVSGTSRSSSSSRSSSPSSRSSSRRSDSSSPQGTSYTKLEGESGTVKVEDLGEKGKFKYTILSPASFSYVWYEKDGTTVKKKNDSVTTSNYSTNWNNTAAAINKLPVQSGAATAAPAATTPAPAATTDQAPAAQGQGEVVVDNLVTNVAKILSNVDAGHTYALRTVANEKRMVRLMLRAIQDMTEGSVIDSSLALAKVIVGSARAALANSNLAKADPSAVAGMSERDIERTFAPELQTIMRAVVRLDAALGGKSGYSKLSSYVRVEVPAKPASGGASNIAAPALGGTIERRPLYTFEGVSPSLSGSADNGLTVDKKSSLDPRIKKLAKLRRLRVRGQMEAAIEPSARFGHSRVS